MSDERINSLAIAIDTFQNDPERLKKVLKRAKISDLLVLHFLNVGVSGCSPHQAMEAIEEELMDHFASGGSYLNR